VREPLLYQRWADGTADPRFTHTLRSLSEASLAESDRGTVFLVLSIRGVFRKRIDAEVWHAPDRRALARVSGYANQALMSLAWAVDVSRFEQRAYERDGEPGGPESIASYYSFAFRTERLRRQATVIINTVRPPIILGHDYDAVWTLLGG
jgi:hypothetical protein